MSHFCPTCGQFVDERPDWWAVYYRSEYHYGGRTWCRFETEEEAKKFAARLGDKVTSIGRRSR